MDTLGYLSDFALFVEPFCHPSNTGDWTGLIFSFISRLTATFIERKNIEAKQNCTTPLQYKLDDITIARFCEIIYPLALLGIFGKNNSDIDAAQSCIKYLAYLAPDLVFPNILPMIYSSFEDLTSTHRTVASMALITVLIPTLIKKGHFPKGQGHLIKLLCETYRGLIRMIKKRPS